MTLNQTNSANWDDLQFRSGKSCIHRRNILRSLLACSIFREIKKTLLSDFFLLLQFWPTYLIVFPNMHRLGIIDLSDRFSFSIRLILLFTFRSIGTVIGFGSKRLCRSGGAVRIRIVGSYFDQIGIDLRMCRLISGILIAKCWHIDWYMWHAHGFLTVGFSGLRLFIACENKIS